MRSFIYLFFSRFNYSKGHGICAFLLPEILSFQGSAHLLGVGSFSNLSDEDTTNKSVVVKNSLIYPGGKADEHSEQIQNFFLNYLGMGGFSRKPEMEDLANDLMKKRQPIDRLYCDRLLTLAKYDEENRGEIDFSKYAIFPYESARGLKRVKACELVIGKPYIKEGNLLASALNRETLWKGFNKLLKRGRNARFN